MTFARLALAGALIASIAPSQARIFADDAGRKIDVPNKVERVYAAGPPASVVVFGIAPDKLIGWTRAFRPDEAALVPKKYADLPELGRLTGRGNTANVEVVLKTKPDLIVDIGSTRDTFVSLAERVQEQTKIPYVLLDGRFDAMPSTFRKLGVLLNEEKRGNQLADYLDASFADVKKRVAQVPADKHPEVYYARGPQGLQTGLKGSINMEALDFMGVKNVAADQAGGLANVGLEQVVLWNPQVIVTNDPNFYREVWKLPVWSNVKAVRDKRVHLSPHLPFGWFDFPPGANRTIGLWWLGKTLYPEQFKDVDLAAKVREFYKLFYHQEPTPAQIKQLLDEPGVAAPAK
jgi:iron complex transport system substrate-binding protein